MSRTTRPLEPRQVVRLLTGNAARHPFSIAARTTERRNAAEAEGNAESWECWRCRTVVVKPDKSREVDRFAEDIARHQAGECDQVRKPTIPGRYRRQLRRPGPPRICGEVHPALGAQPAMRGDDELAPVVCTARVTLEDDPDGKPVLKSHRGRHRAKLAGGVIIRWDTAEQTKRKALRAFGLGGRR